MCSCDPNKKCRRVRFNDDRLKVEFQLESDSHVNEKWLSRADFKAIHLNIFSALDATYLNRTVCASQEEEDTYRGLESLDSCRRQMITHFVQDFLEIQEEYRVLGFNFESLAGFAVNNSKSSRERARLTADQDASEARSVYGEPLLL